MKATRAPFSADRGSLRQRFAEPMGGAEKFDGSLGANVAKVYGDLEARLYP